MVSYCCITNYFQGQLLKTRIISLHCFQVPGSVAGSTDLGWAPFGTAEGLSGSAAGWVKLEQPCFMYLSSPSWGPIMALAEAPENSRNNQGFFWPSLGNGSPSLLPPSVGQTTPMLSPDSQRV